MNKEWYYDKMHRANVTYRSVSKYAIVIDRIRFLGSIGSIKYEDYLRSLSK